MFGISFGWSKASKCKKVMNRARCRLRQLKNKRQTIATQLRKDLAELILNGHEETALNRVEQLIKDESLVAAYELLDHFFVFILKQLSYIRKHRDCPTDINEAVSSIIFASARFGDFPELYSIRKLFRQRYGKQFAAAAEELFPGNLVNKKLKENLSVKSVPDYLKHIIVEEIARDNGLQPKEKEYKGNQLVENDVQIIDTFGGSKIHPSEIEEIEGDVMCDSLSITIPSDAFSSPESTLNDTSALVVSTVQQYPPYQSYPQQEKVKDVEYLQNKGKIMALSSAEKLSLAPFPYAEAVVDYVDDTEECQYYSVSGESSCQDQSLLFDSDESDTNMDQDDSTSEKSSIRSYTERKRGSKKILRKRSAFFESQGKMEIGYMTYYQKPSRSPSTQKYGTHYCRQKISPLLERIPQSSFPQKRPKQHSSSSRIEKSIKSCECQGGGERNSFDLNMSDCSLDNPCYCCVYYNDEECWEMEPKNGMELVVIPQKLNRGSGGAVGYHLLTYLDSLTRTETTTPYARALTMSPKWPNNHEDNFLRTYSCTSQQPKHVHPKLPDYDNFVATFTALKKECELRGQ